MLNNSMQCPKRVAILRNSLLSISETFIRDQVTALKDWSPVFFGFSSVEGGLNLSGMECHVIPSSRLVQGIRSFAPFPSPSLVEMLRKSNAMLAHAHFGMDAVKFWPSVKAAGLPMLVTLHGYDVNIRRDAWQSGKLGQHMRRYPHQLQQLGAEKKIHFVAVSNALMHHAIELGIPQNKISVNYIGVDVDRFRSEGQPLWLRRKRILFTGRMVEKKAPLLMVRAFAEVRKSVPEAELAMIGAGPLLEPAKALANELSVPVDFLGAQPASVVQTELQRARVFCLPSLTAPDGDAEGFGIVLLEAQASGVPVVTSARGGSTEGLLNGITGHAFEEGNIAACVSGLLHFLSDDLPPDTSDEARRFVAGKFDIRQCTAKLEALYDEQVIMADG